MSRSYLAIVLVLIGCGDNIPVEPDAAPPDAAPDAMGCVLPDKMCGSVCTPVATDEDNCGNCGVTCNAGETCDMTCMCPAPFLGASITPSGFDMFETAGSITIAINPNITGAINPLIVGFLPTTPLDTDIDVSMIAIGSPPFVATAYNFNLNTMMIDASYSMTAGTLRLTKACATEAMGTLTDATFRGVTGGFANPMVDPDGCMFTVPTVAFHMMTSACP